MQDWESLGSVPQSCSDPKKLSDYMQGKKSRDWHISEWRLGVKQGLFWPEEFIGTLGLTRENFESIFGCEIREERMRILREVEEELKRE